MDSACGPEFTRPIGTTRLGQDEMVIEIAATPDERAALARRFDLIALERLEACVRLRRVGGGLIRLVAAFSAEVVQECVVTLEPVASRLEDAFTVLFGAMPGTPEVMIDSEAEIIEPLDGDIIDVGETVAQQLSLVLDPFPRAPGATLPAEPAEPETPFAVLADWAKKP